MFSRSNRSKVANESPWTYRFGHLKGSRLLGLEPVTCRHLHVEPWLSLASAATAAAAAVVINIIVAQPIVTTTAAADSNLK